LVGCGGDDANGPALHHDAGTAHDDDAGSGDAIQRFVGAVDDDDARVAVVSDRAQLRLFFCGSQGSVATSTSWFNLDVHDGAIAVAAPFKVSATIAADGVIGSVTRADGIARHFHAAPIAQGTLAGLYEGTSDCGRLGLIVTQAAPDAELSAQGACVGDGHAPEQVNPILPLTSQAGRIPVQTPGDAASATLLRAASLQPL
jgi:hypothetical protein